MHDVNGKYIIPLKFKQLAGLRHACATEDQGFSYMTELQKSVERLSRLLFELVHKDYCALLVFSYAVYFST